MDNKNMTRITQRAFGIGGVDLYSSVLVSANPASDPSKYIPELGQRFEDNNGDVYVFVRTTTAIPAGVMVQKVKTSASFANLPLVAVPAVVARIRNFTITIALAGITANQFAGGKANVVVGTGLGLQLGISSNTATNSSGNVSFTLSDVIPTNALGTALVIDATSRFTLTQNFYNGVSQTDGAVTNGDVAGATFVAIPAQSFGFIKEKGICPVLFTGAALAVGNPIAVSEAVAGAVFNPAAVSTDTIVGRTVIACTTGQTQPVYLNI